LLALFVERLSAIGRRRAVITASRERTSPPPRLLDVLQQPSAKRGHSVRTIRAYLDWTTRFILFHVKWHPRDLTKAEVSRFLGHVAQWDKEGCSPGDRGRTHNPRTARPDGNAASKVVWQQELWKQSMPPQSHGQFA